MTLPTMSFLPTGGKTMLSDKIMKTILHEEKETDVNQRYESK